MHWTRATITLFFFADGLLIGTWAARIPAVQEDTGEPAVRPALFGCRSGTLMPVVAGWLRRESAAVASPLLRSSPSASSCLAFRRPRGLAVALFGWSGLAQ